MRGERVSEETKGWFAGPWNSGLSISVGFANAGIDEPHAHTRVTEIYLIARGSSSIRVEHQTFELQEGDALFIDPGEAHTFLAHSDDYLHYVIHSPGMAGEEAAAEKELVPRARLGL